MSNDIMLSIQREVYNYHNRYGVEPNVILIGEESHRELLSEIRKILGTDKEFDTVYGMELYVDYENPKLIRLGYFEGVI